MRAAGDGGRVFAEYLGLSGSRHVVPDGVAHGQPAPIVSTLNDYRGLPAANAALVPAGTGGAVNVLVSQDSHVAIDVNGYFAQ